MDLSLLTEDHLLRRLDRYLGYEEGACPICGFDSCEMCGGCCALLAFWSDPTEE